LRVFAVSDIHIDYEENRRWLHGLSKAEYTDDVLILAGDVTDIFPLLLEAFELLTKRFRKVLFVPGNHDLWVHRNNGKDSLDQFYRLAQIAIDYGISTDPLQCGKLSIVPLLGWYDYSFGQPVRELKHLWVDFIACTWPDNLDEAAITRLFVNLNEKHLHVENHTIISFSHFLPRIDLMPSIIPVSKRVVYPVLGTNLLEGQIRRLTSRIHVYGHSHVNMQVKKDGILYLNNAFGYPDETRIAAKRLVCIHEI